MFVLKQHAFRSTSPSLPEPLACLDGRGFEFRRHRVVKAVEETEQRDHGDDVHDLGVRIMLPQLGKIRVGDGVWHLGGALRDTQRRSLCLGEQRAGLVLPQRILFLG